MKLSTLTPALRSEASTVAATLKAAIAAERAAGKEYFSLMAERPAVAAKMLEAARNPGMGDPTSALVRFDQGVAASVPDGARSRLVAACEATHPFQVRAFNFIRAQLVAAVREAVKPFFTPQVLDQLPFATELEQRVNGLAMRLRLSAMQTFEEALRQSELTAQVLEDFANGREVFHLEPAEVPATA